MYNLQGYLLFVVIISVLLDITEATVEYDSISAGKLDHPEAKSKKCNPLIPGLDKMQSGIDITKVQLFPSDKDPTNGYRKKIYKFTCNDKVAWTNELTSQEYMLPDQLEVPMVMLYTSKLEFSKMTRGSREYQDSVAVEVGLSGIPTTKSATVGGSVNIKNIEEKFFGELAYVYQMARKSMTYTFSLQNASSLPLSENFIASVKQLPLNYQNDPSKYDSFIEDYGTHYFDQATMGGRFYQSIEIKQHYVNSYTDNEIKVNAEGTFSNSFKADVKSSTRRVMQEFTNSSTVSEKLIGGNQSYYGKFSQSNSASMFNDWAHSLNKLPWIVNGRMKPIYNLVEDPNTKTQLEMAVNVYFVSIKYDMAERKAKNMRIFGGYPNPETVEPLISQYSKMYSIFRNGPINPTTIKAADAFMDEYLDLMDNIEALTFIFKQYKDFFKFYKKNYDTAMDNFLCGFTLTIYCKWLEAKNIVDGFKELFNPEKNSYTHIHQLVEEVRKYQKEYVQPFKKRNGFPLTDE